MLVGTTHTSVLRIPSITMRLLKYLAQVAFQTIKKCIHVIGNV